jgi:hypothetical protein
MLQTSKRKTTHNSCMLGRGMGLLNHLTPNGTTWSHGLKNSSKEFSGEEGINHSNENERDNLLGRYHSFEGSTYSLPPCKSDNSTK